MQGGQMGFDLWSKKGEQDNRWAALFGKEDI